MYRPSEDNEWYGLNKTFFLGGKKYNASDLILCGSTFQESAESYFLNNPVQCKADDSDKQTSPNSSYSNKKGEPRHALLLNNFKFENVKSNINGGYKDTINLYDALVPLGWDITLAENKTSVELDKELENFLEKLGENTSAVLIFISSHGERRQNQDHFMTADGKFRKLNSILAKFSETNCLKLADKPKIFLTDFCRKKSEAIPLSKEVERGVYNPVKPEDNRNMLIAYATLAGRASYNAEGSWFVTIFTNALKEQYTASKRLSLKSILELANKRVTLRKEVHEGVTYCQVSTFEPNDNFKQFFF